MNERERETFVFHYLLLPSGIFTYRRVKKRWAKRTIGLIKFDFWTSDEKFSEYFFVSKHFTKRSGSRFLILCIFHKTFVVGTRNYVNLLIFFYLSLSRNKSYTEYKVRVIIIIWIYHFQKATDLVLRSQNPHASKREWYPILPKDPIFSHLPLLTMRVSFTTKSKL